MTNQKSEEMQVKKNKRSIKIILSVTLIVIVIWTVWENLTVGVTHYTVVSDKLPSSFDHYKIAVVSDLHNAEFGKNNGTLISLIENEKPDIIAITGDLIDSNRTNIEVAEKLVEDLAQIAPCYYITGNHEGWLGEQYKELEKKLVDAGAVILHNKAEQIEKNNEIIQLFGLDDPSFRYMASVHKIMMNIRSDNMDLTDGYSILLSHRPELFSEYVAEDIDLVLSGHAHGGQFRLPLIGGVVAPSQGLFPKYDAGEYSDKNTTMIVSRGIGNSIIPIRFNNRPEIVIVELICE